MRSPQLHHQVHEQAIPEAAAQAEEQPEEQAEEQVEALRLAHPNLDAWFARLLSSRGVKAQQLESFLEPRVRELMPDPSRLADMDKAVGLLVKALAAKQKIGIITDYDVDGACCAAMFIAYWRNLGGVCSYTIPDRINEGYGANSAAFARLFDDGVDGLVLTTDCGTNDAEVFALARKEWAERSAKAGAAVGAAAGAGAAAESAAELTAAGKPSLDIIVLDHHEIADHEMANHAAGVGCSVFAMINPQRADNRVDATSLSACGVVFLLLVALRRRLLAGAVGGSPSEPKPSEKKSSEKKSSEQKSSELKSSELKPWELKLWLDLVALATICDVVELSPLNRAFVRLGLHLLTSSRHAGLAQMAKLGYERGDKAAAKNNGDSGDSDRIFTTRDIGFFFGPRLNACGRMGEPRLAVELLLCVDSDSAARARQLVRKIEELNATRRELQAACAQQVLAAAESVSVGDAKSKVCFFSHQNWSVGVLGPCASRVAEQLGHPIFLANEKLVSSQSQKSSQKSSQESSRESSQESPQDFLRGSARLPQWGWDACNLARVATRAKDAGLLLSAGGHSRACGFTLHRKFAREFSDFLNEAFFAQAQEAAEFRGFIDMELLPSAATFSLAENLSRLAPFGRGNEEPLFAFRDVFIDNCRFVGKAQRHLVCSISAQGGVSRARAIAFDAHASGLGEALRKAADERRPRWLVGKVRADNYTGYGQIVIEDFACSIEGIN